MQPSPTAQPAPDPITCPRCETALQYVGTKRFHEGSRGWAFWLDNLGEEFRPH